MKLFESKHYIKPLTVEYSFRRGLIVKTGVEVYSYDDYSDILGRKYANLDLRDERLVISQEILLSSWQECDDFEKYEVVREEGKLYLVEGERCFYHEEYEVFLIVPECKKVAKDGEAEAFLNVGYLYYDPENKNSKTSLQAVLNSLVASAAAIDKAECGLLIPEDNQLTVKFFEIKPLPLQLQHMYPESFLPVHDHIYRSLKSGNKGIVLLHGLPGTGKTNYIKWLANLVPDKKFIFIPSSMIGRLTDPSFLSLMTEHTGAVLVMEDCENYIVERSQNPMNTDVVTSILNLADGILSDILGCQIICTFNSELSKVDRALLRKGRLIAEYYFGMLPQEQCQAYLDAESIDIEAKEAMCLADLTNLMDNAPRLSEGVRDIRITERRKIGF